MPFSIRPFRRFPVCCPVTYQCDLSEGQGTVWNFSVNGWKLSGDVPLQVGQMCSLTVNLPNNQASLWRLRSCGGPGARSTAWKPWRLTRRYIVGWRVITRLEQDSFESIE